MIGVPEDPSVLTRRRHLLMLVALAVVVAVLAPAVGPDLLRAWQGRGEHDCVSPAADSLHDVPREALPRTRDADRDRHPPAEAEGGCLARSSYSIRARHGGTSTLTFSYERFDATWKGSGASAASHRLAAQRPQDATAANLESYAYDEGHVVSEEQGGRSSVELLVRGRNVLVKVSYLGPLPLASATSAAQAVADTLLEEVEDLNFPTG